MSWTLDKKSRIWKCSSYTDLTILTINKLAQYGQPRSPYESDFERDFVPDFGNVVVEMPQQEVMTNGYGRNITAESFPFVRRFLEGNPPLPFGTYTFADLVKLGIAHEGEKKNDKRIKSNLYSVQGKNEFGITAGRITTLDAAYAHGTVSLALMENTKFISSSLSRRVEAEIGAGDDNWDFESSTIPGLVNGIVQIAIGPKGYKLTAPIRILFRGPGKRSVAERKIPAAPVVPKPPEAANAPRADWLTGVQYRLKFLAYYTDPVHGQNTRATKDAVLAFQTDQRIGIDGIPGPQTQQELVKVCGF